MPVAGLEVYNADSSLALGLTTRTTRQLGMFERVGGSQGAGGSAIDDGFLTGTPFFIVTPINSAAIPIIPQVKVVGNTITWNYSIPGGVYPPGAVFLVSNILYGVY